MDEKFFQKFEYQGLRKLYRRSPRNPQQLNIFNSSDTETVRLRKDLFLTSSTDSIAVEIHSKLYKNPATWGYLAVANSVSDMAASGSKPVGLLLSAQWQKSHNGLVKEKIYHAVSQALKVFDVPLLGGDSGSSSATVLTTTILGESHIRPLDRTGVKPGDVVVLFGNNLGFGPALAFDFLRNKSKGNFENKFRPLPNWQSIYKFRKYFKASIDTSDGIYNSFLTLSQLNNVSFKVNLKSIVFNKTIQNYKAEFQIPTEYFVESDLGDLQTCIILDSEIYRRIKNKLPYHQAIASCEKKNGAPVWYEENIHHAHYSALPTLLEDNQFRYSQALGRWLRQFSS